MAKAADTPLDDLDDLVASLVGALKVPGEAALVAAFLFAREVVALEREVLRADPELALANRARLERGLVKLDKLGDVLLAAIGVKLDEPRRPGSSTAAGP